MYFEFTTKAGELTELVGDDTAYSNLIMRIDDGSDSDDMPNGSHYYRLTDICNAADGTGYSCRAYIGPCESTGTGAADTSSDTPALSEDTTATIFDASGDTYKEMLEEVHGKPQLAIGDSDGYVYVFDETYIKDETSPISGHHYTPSYDWGLPDGYKYWPAITIQAEGTADGAMYVGYRTADFDTSGTGWTDFTFDLTGNFLSKTFYPHVTSEAIQLKFQDFSGKYFAVREYKIHDPIIESNR